MYKLFTQLFFLTLWMTACNVSKYRKAEPVDVLVRNTNIIDVVGGHIIPGKDVLIKNGIITGIYDHGKYETNAVNIINGEGKYLSPGYWDMHVHSLLNNWYTWQLPLFTANGIIGIRDMWGDLELADSIKTEMFKGNLPFVHFKIPGHIIDGKKPYWPGSLSAPDTHRAIQLVDSLAAAGAHFLKLYSSLEPEVFDAIVKRAKEKNILFAGHVPARVWLTKASEAGMSSMEHLYGFHIEACAFPDSAMKLKTVDMKNYEAGMSSSERQAISRVGEKFVLENFSEERMRWVAAILKKNNTHIVPTLVTLRGNYFSNDTALKNDSRLQYMSKETRDFWREQSEFDNKRFTEEDWINKRKRYEVEKKIVKILWQEGVPIMAGSDSDNPHALPAFGIHDELELLVAFGMSPIDALRSATINPIKFLKLTDSLGTIEKGKRADMVLLNSNPLSDIRHTKNIHSVFINGKLFQPSDLEKLKEQVLKMNTVD